MPRILALMSTDHFSGPTRQLLQLVEHVQCVSRYQYHLGFICRIGKEKPKFFELLKAQRISFSILNERWAIDFSLLKQLKDLTTNKKIAIIQTHGYKPSVLGFFLKRRVTPLSWIAFLHGHTAENFKVKCYFALENLAVRKADAIVAVSETMRQKLLKQGFYDQKTHSILNAIDANKFHASTEIKMNKDLLQRILNLKKCGPIIGVIGRMSPEKGHILFLRSFQQVLKEIPRANALLLGTGQLETKLRKICKELGLEKHVIFGGFQQNVNEWYPYLDIVVIPSLSEGLPNVALEAMLFEKPVVATKVGGVPEVVEDGLTGSLVPANDVGATTNAICALLKNPDLMMKYGKNGHGRVLTNFSPAFRAKKTIKLYNSILN
jgi:glycosyltransferase involved in cell wall biosynthesis